MELSGELLRLVDLLAERNVPMHIAIAAVENVSWESSREERSKFFKGEDKLRGLARVVADAKLKPFRVLDEKETAFLIGIPEDNLLDAHFTTLFLSEVPRIVVRWKKLQELPVALLPGEKITSYLRQAGTCYLLGA